MPRAPRAGATVRRLRRRDGGTRARQRRPPEGAERAVRMSLRRGCHGTDIWCSLPQAVFHNFVDNIKDELFEGTVEVLFGRLDSAAEAVGKAKDVADALWEETMAELEFAKVHDILQSMKR